MNTPNAKDLKIYEVTLRATGEKSFKAAVNAQDACKQAGWLIGGCFIVEQKPRRRASWHTYEPLFIQIPCEVCPFQYGECRKPADTLCPVQPDAPELHEWLKQAAQAHLCDYYGQELKKADFQKRLKWIKINDAILELSPKPPSPTENPPHSTCATPSAIN